MRANTAREAYRVMDPLARKKRLQQELDQLELDNFHQDPHANLSLSKKLPKFDETLSSGNKPSDRRRSNIRLRVLNFSQMVEEDAKRPAPNYSTAVAPEPEKFNLARRHFCSVCGYNGKYTCVTCGARFCTVACQGTHKDTRCMRGYS